MFHVLNSIGFAHMLPVSLALFAKLAPKAINATVIGLYYLAFFAGNSLVGWIGGFYSTMPTTQFWLLHAGLRRRLGRGVRAVQAVRGKAFRRPGAAPTRCAEIPRPALPGRGTMRSMVEGSIERRSAPPPRFARSRLRREIDGVEFDFRFASAYRPAPRRPFGGGNDGAMTWKIAIDYPAISSRLRPDAQALASAAGSGPADTKSTEPF